MRTGAAAALLVLAACDGGASAGKTPDGGAPAGGGKKVTLVNDTNPPGMPLAWVAFQDGDGPWKTVAGSAGRYTFETKSGRFGVAFVCVRDFVAGEVVQATTAELTELRTECATEVAQGARLSGTIKGAVMGAPVGITAAAGQGLYPVSVDAKNTSYQATVPAGTYDVAAVTPMFGAPEKALIHRAVTVQGDTKLDLDFGGPDARGFTAQPLTVKGLAMGESLEGYVELYTKRGAYATWSAPDVGAAMATYPMLAMADLDADDGLDLSVLAAGGQPLAVRGVMLGFRGPVTQTVTLPPRFEATVDTTDGVRRPRMTFQPYPDALFYQLNATAIGGLTPRGWLGIASRAWLGTATTYELPDLTAAEGFDPGWSFEGKDNLQVESYGVGSSRDFARTIAADRATRVGARLTFSKTIDMLGPVR